MNKQEAIRLAKDSGLKVSGLKRKIIDGVEVRILNVGEAEVFHAGGGSGCWRIQHNGEIFDSYCYIGSQIKRAVEAQL